MPRAADHCHHHYNIIFYYHNSKDTQSSTPTHHQIMTTATNRNSLLYDYHQQYHEESSSKSIQMLSQIHRVQGNITAEVLSSPKRKRNDDFVEYLEDKDTDSIVCPLQKRSASSTRPMFPYCISAYDLEQREGPADDVSLDDGSDSLVSNFRISVFRHGQQDVSSSDTLITSSSKMYGKDGDEEIEHSYSDFPSIGRARTITGSFDSVFSKSCYADPPDMAELSRSSSHEVEETVEQHNNIHSDCLAHVLLCHRHEEQDTSDETRECPEWIASSATFGEMSLSRQTVNAFTTKEEMFWPSD